MEPLSGSALHFFLERTNGKKEVPDQNVRQGKSDSLVSCQKMDGAQLVAEKHHEEFPLPRC